MWIDEFSRNELRESHATIQELTSQTQELQGRGEQYEWFTRISRYRIDVQWKSIPRSQSIGNCSKSLLDAEPRPVCDLIHGICRKHRETFSGNPRAAIDSSQTNQRAAGGNTVQRSAGRLVAKGEERNRVTIPTPRFARRPSTMNSFSPAEIPKNSMADQQRPQISELHFDKFPTSKPR